VIRLLINVVFEGGGVKGLAYIGVLRFLEGRGFKINKVGGTSIGAVFASLVAAGFDSYRMEELVNDFNLNILTSSSRSRTSSVITSIKQKGIHSIANFEKYLDSLLKAKNKEYFKNVKFGEDYLLKIVTMDWKRRKKVVLPNDLVNYGYNIDDFKISKAVAMSCSIPIYFRPYKLKDDVFYDGGVVNNFPITLFEDDNIPTLGFRLNESIKTKKDDLITKYTKKIFKYDGDYDFDKYNIIEIDTLGIKAIDFKKGLDMKIDLYLAGYNSIRRYFYNHFNS
jgi:NTE family protein